MPFPKTIKPCLLSMLLFVTIPCFAQTKTISVDLPGLVKEKKVAPFNRNVSVLQTDNQKKGIHMDEKPGPGWVWLKDIRFANGTIAFDVKGKNVPQSSFVGIAFHGKESTYDAVYFRPFNFQAQNPVNKSHAVQYISFPDNDWFKLRNEHPDKYEQPIDPAPDPEAWFHVRIVIADPTISVYVNDQNAPCLKVDKLNNRKEGMVGFWVGNGSGGDFANLKLTAD